MYRCCARGEKPRSHGRSSEEDARGAWCQSSHLQRETETGTPVLLSVTWWNKRDLKYELNVWCTSFTARRREEEAENRDVGEHPTGKELQRNRKTFSSEFQVELLQVHLPPRHWMHFRWGIAFTEQQYFFSEKACVHALNCAQLLQAAWIAQWKQGLQWTNQNVHAIIFFFFNCGNFQCEHADFVMQKVLFCVQYWPHSLSSCCAGNAAEVNSAKQAHVFIQKQVDFSCRQHLISCCRLLTVLHTVAGHGTRSWRCTFCQLLLLPDFANWLPLM